MRKTKIKSLKKKHSVKLDTSEWLINSVNSSPQKRFNKSNLWWNSVILLVIILSVISGMFLQLGNIQIVNGALYKNKSETNRFSEIKIRAPRGVVYDRNEVQLTTNVPAYRLMVDTSKIETSVEEIASALSSVLEVESQEIQDLISEKSYIGQDKILITKELTKDQFLLINASLPEMPGVYIEEDAKRYYPYKNVLSHVLGFTGEATETNVKEDGYALGDAIGKEGLEFQYENLLRGVDGQQSVVIDVSGSIISEQSVVSPVNGQNLKLSIDIQAQSKLYELLSNAIKETDSTGAAAMLMDIETGEIIAAVSLPSYDNNLFVGGIGYDEYNNLIQDEARPLLNRFLGTAQPPGSTFKTITAVAGLDSKSITKDTIFNSTGVFYLGNYPFQEYQKHVYGPLNVVQALSKSSNIFFYETILRMDIDTLSSYANRMGVGKMTGIDIPGEIEGNFSSPEYKALITNEPWYPGDSLNAAIGQGYNRVTPVQMLKWISAIGNGGKFVTPHFLKEYQKNDKTWAAAEYAFQDLGIGDDVLSLVRSGMRESVATGIVYTLRNTKVPVAAKTGTAEFGVKDDKGNYTKSHAWITGFFPYEDPKYSFVFFQEAGGLGSASGKVANDFINWFVDYENSF